jgi:hypothetical protein
VPYGTDLVLHTFQAINCLATIIQSLRDARGHHSTTPRGRIRGREQPVRRSFLRSLVGSSVSERSRKNEAPCEHLGRNHTGDIRRPGFTSVAHSSHAVIVACP